MTGVFARIGLLSFGGPAGQIALMHREIVEARGWASEERFLRALNFCMLLPGPEAQQLSVYLGWRLHGARGGLVAGLLFILPGLLTLLALSTAYVLWREASWLAALFFGLKAAVLAIVAEATLRIGRRALKGPAPLLLASAAFLALFAFKAPFPLVVLAAALIGAASARLRLGWFRPVGHGAAGEESTRTAAPLRLGRALTTLTLGLALWAAPVALVAASLGTASVFTQTGLFFSKMAVVTFGGAYAVLAYVGQEAVERYRWLTPGEMVDGLALAETTPGPLILVLVFVGYLAGFRDPGPFTPFGAAVLAALMTTWVTFVPCFLWILLGAPMIERIKPDGVLDAAFSAVSAAVVGVILNLSVWFALNVLFRRVGALEAGPLRLPAPDWTSFDLRAAGLALVAAAALFVFKLGAPRTLALCAALGAGLSLAW
jgi:chromate transporter